MFIGGTVMAKLAWSWALGHLHLLLYGTIIAFVLSGLAWVRHSGVEACQSQEKFNASATLISGQQAGIGALNLELAATTIRDTRKQAIMQTIRGHNAKEDDAPAAGIVSDTIGRLYAH